MRREELERGDVVAVVRKPIDPPALLEALRRSLASSAPFG
jgi:CheY-like chemotaxis protein